MKYAFFLYFFSLAKLHQAPPVLEPYESFAHFDVDKYTEQYNRDLDSDGIITQDNEYHALTISIYGIINYDAFIETGDSVYSQRVIDQFKYFDDPSNLVLTDNGASAGLPYRFYFQGLPSPWYSGMTQGTAVSFLLRYYSLTKNPEALERCRQLMHLMLKDEQDGGMISKTLEGGVWIEEYPAPSDAKSVLNGFINGYLGVYEYSQFFPGNKRSAMVRDSSYAELIRNVHCYDKPDWTRYARYAKGGNITISYLRYQLEEFDHLYSLHHDEHLRQQMRIWSRFGAGLMDTTSKFLKNPDYTFAWTYTITPGTMFMNVPVEEKFRAALAKNKPESRGNNLVGYRFQTERCYAEYKVLAPELKGEQIAVHAFLKGESVPITIVINENKGIIESQIPFDSLSMTFRKNVRMRNAVILSSYDYKRSELPMYVIVNMPGKKLLTGGTAYTFECAGKNLTNATVFYRYAPSLFNVVDSNFRTSQSFAMEQDIFTVPQTGYYEFFMCYDLAHPTSGFGPVEMEEK